jgi:hypothetical protein
MVHARYKRYTATYKLGPLQKRRSGPMIGPQIRHSTMRRREDTQDKSYFRSERVFGLNGQWYFGSREGDCGPFATPAMARRALERFISDKVELAAFQKSREREIRKPKLTLAERLKLDTVGSSRAFDAPELLI